MEDVVISKEKMAEAVERQKKAFEKELEGVDIRAVVLKTKKSVLEQAKVCLRIQNAYIEQQGIIQKLQKDMEKSNHDMEDLFELVAEMKLTFKQAIEILSKETEKKTEQPKKGFFSKIWDFIKCPTS